MDVGYVEESKQSSGLDAASSWSSHSSLIINKDIDEGEAPITAPNQVPAKARMSFKEAVIGQKSSAKVVISYAETVKTTRHYSLENLPPALIASGTEDVKAADDGPDAASSSSLPPMPPTEWIPAGKAGREERMRVAEALQRAAEGGAIVVARNKFAVLLEEGADTLDRQQQQQCSLPPLNLDMEGTATRRHNWLKKLPLGRILRGLKNALRIGKALVVVVPRGLMRMACMGGSEDK